MSTPIRNLLDSIPEPEHAVIIDDEPWYRFTCSYRHEGREFCFDIWAMSQVDAEERMTALRSTATVDGQVMATRDA